MKIKKLNEEKIFEKAQKGKISILSDPDCSLLKDCWGNTPLHYLAKYCKIEVLQHPDCSLIKNNDGETPLHYLAARVLRAEKVKKILQHPDCSLVKDNEGRTPLHLLAGLAKINPAHLKKLFPWYKRKRRRKVSEEEITEILSTSKSVLYILE